MEKQDFQRIDSLLDDIAEDTGNVIEGEVLAAVKAKLCLLYTSPSPRD